MLLCTRLKDLIQHLERMKVILLRDVAKIGKRYEVVNVPDGYALNKLIPQKDAQAATPDNVKRVANMRLKNKSDKEGVLSALKKGAAQITEEPLVITMQANEQGHLFQSVHAADIVAAAAKRSIDIPEEYVVFTSPIKSVGVHTAILKAQGESFTISLNVLPK